MQDIQNETRSYYLGGPPLLPFSPSIISFLWSACVSDSETSYVQGDEGYITPYIVRNRNGSTISPVYLHYLP